MAIWASIALLGERDRARSENEMVKLVHIDILYILIVAI